MLAAGCGRTNIAASADAVAHAAAAQHDGTDAPRTEPDAGPPSSAAPIDLAHLQRNPCAALPPGQISGLLGPGAQSTPDTTSEMKPGCIWTGKSIAIGVSIPDKKGSGSRDFLGRTYPAHEPAPPVRGYAATKYATPDTAKTKSCIVALAVGEQMVAATVRQTVSASPPDPCEAARTTLDLVLATAGGPR